MDLLEQMRLRKRQQELVRTNVSEKDTNEKQSEKASKNKQMIKTSGEEKDTSKPKIIRVNKSDLDTHIKKEIDNKMSKIINERLMSLVKIGLRHELTIKNMEQYFKEVRKTKLYELKRYFSDSNLNEIDKILVFLYEKGFLIKDRNGWYSLSKKLNPERN